jgi:hypothetical protein
MEPSRDTGGFAWPFDPWHVVHEVTVTSMTPLTCVGLVGAGWQVVHVAVEDATRDHRA